MEIHATGNTRPAVPTGPTEKSDKPANFAVLMQHYIEQSNQESKAAGKAATELALGKSHNVSETLLAIQKADLSFQLMLSVRNKLVSAYREVMRMQV